ncbi:hypothetical protein I204_06504 [Kwoniella mangroviensis CBS 8886]|nr:hypothetical protein I204_06504 [Kwoniella mangroviensis CBS 8886]
MPNWVTDNTSVNVNPDLNSTPILHDPPVTADLPLTDDDSTKPHQIHRASTKTDMSDSVQLPQAQHMVQGQGQDPNSAIVLSPDSPSQSTLPDPPSVSIQPTGLTQTIQSSTSADVNMQSILPQQPVNQLSHFGSTTPQEQSPAVTHPGLPNAPQQQPPLRQVVSSGSGGQQNGFQMHTNSHQHFTAQSPINNTTVGQTNTSRTNPSPTFTSYTFNLKNNQIATVNLSPEYAMRRHKITMGSGSVLQLSTIELLNRYSQYLTLVDLDQVIKDPRYIATLFGSMNHQHGRVISQPLPQQASSSAHPSSARPTHHVASNGYAYIPQDAPAQVQQSIVNLQHQARPSSRQSGSARVGGSGTPLQSPRDATSNVIIPPEVQVIQQKLNADVHGVEQKFGQAWEQLRMAMNDAVRNMASTVTAIKPPADTEAITNQLRAQLSEEEKKVHLSQMTVLRLTESESKARAELTERMQQLQTATDVRYKAQELNTALARGLEEVKRGKEAGATQIVQLQNQVNAQSAKLTQLESEHRDKLAQLDISHIAVVANLKKELAEAVHKANQPVFGAHLPGPLSPKSPADPSSEAAKLRSLLKANNAKFTELEGKYNKEIAELKAHAGKDPREIEKDIRTKLAQTNDAKIERLESKVKELEVEKEKIVHERKVHDQSRFVLEKIVHWGENLQSKLGRTNEQNPKADGTSGGTINGDTTNRSLVDRANTFVSDKSKLAEMILTNEKDRKEKMKKLQGQVELMKVELAASQSGNPPASSNGTEQAGEEWKVAFHQLISWGHNIQILMGKTVEPSEENMKPIDKAEQFQKTMHTIFEEIQSKAQSRLEGGDQEKVKELEGSIQTLNNNLQANLNALLAKTTQLDDTTKLLQDARDQSTASEKTLREEIDKHKETKRSLEESQAAERAKIDQLEDLKKRLDQAATSLQQKASELESVAEIKGEVQARLVEVEKRLREKEEELNTREKFYSSSIDELRTEYEIDGGSIQKCDPEIRKQVESLKEMIERLEQEKGELQKDLENEQDNVDRAEEAMRGAMNNQHKQRENYIEVEKELENVKEEKHGLEDEIKRLQDQLSAIKSKNNTVGKDEDDDFEIVPDPSSTSTSTAVPKTRPESLLFTPNAENSETPSISPVVRPSPLSQSQPSTSQATPANNKKPAGTPLFLPNEEEEESRSQSVPTPSVLASTQRPYKRKRLLNDESDDEERPNVKPGSGLKVSVSASRPPSVANSVTSVSASTYKPVSRDWIKDHLGITTQKNGDRVRCKLCFVVEKKNQPSERSRTFKVEDIQPLPLVINEEKLLDHIASHGEMLRRLKNKRVKDGKDRPSPEPN